MQPAPEIPDFDLVHRIGKGAFGTVWLGVNRTTGQRRAVKVIPLRPEGGADPAGREIVSLTRLESNLRRTHPDLIAIHHVGKTAEHLFYAMDLADDVSGPDRVDSDLLEVPFAQDTLSSVDADFS